MKRASLSIFLVILIIPILTFPPQKGRDGFVHAADFGTSASPGGKAWESTSITGTTTNSFPGTAQARWKGAKLYDNKQLTIHNTDGSDSLDFKIVIYDNAADTVGHEYPGYGPDAEGVGDPKTLAAGKAAWLAIPEPVYAIEIFLKSTVTDTPATFEVLATGQIKN